MDYNISSKNIDHPLLKPILEELIPIFQNMGNKFFIIGATARDILMQISDEKPGRATMDLDIAIAVRNWNEFEQVSQQITDLFNFTKDNLNKQRFLYKGKYQIDIVPYGDIKDQHDKIFWPPDQSFAMSVLGFEEAEKGLLRIQLDNEINFEIVSLPGIFLLKLVAWKDRFNRTNKDADDIGFILNNYFFINQDLTFEEPYNIVYELENFSTITAAGVLLGKDLNELIFSNAQLKIEVKKILQDEIQKAEESKLINQIIETNRNLKFDEVKEALHLINDQIK